MVACHKCSGHMLSASVCEYGVIAVLIGLLEKQLEGDQFHTEYPFPNFHTSTNVEDVFANPPTLLELKTLCVERASRHGILEQSMTREGRYIPAPRGMLRGAVLAAWTPG